MTYESRAYENEYGEPVVVLVVSGQHDVSRLVNLFNSGMCLVEHLSVGEKMLRQVRRHNGGREALELLRRHGGPDFTADSDMEPEAPTDPVEQLLSHVNVMASQPDAYDLKDMLAWLQGQPDVESVAAERGEVVLTGDFWRLLWLPDSRRWERVWGAAGAAEAARLGGAQ